MIPQQIYVSEDADIIVKDKPNTELKWEVI